MTLVYLLPNDGGGNGALWLTTSADVPCDFLVAVCCFCLLDPFSVCLCLFSYLSRAGLVLANWLLRFQWERGAWLWSVVMVALVNNHGTLHSVLWHRCFDTPTSPVLVLSKGSDNMGGQYTCKKNPNKWKASPKPEVSVTKGGFAVQDTRDGVEIRRVSMQNGWTTRQTQVMQWAVLKAIGDFASKMNDHSHSSEIGFAFGAFCLCSVGRRSGAFLLVVGLTRALSAIGGDGWWSSSLKDLSQSIPYSNIGGMVLILNRVLWPNMLETMAWFMVVHKTNTGKTDVETLQAEDALPTGKLGSQLFCNPVNANPHASIQPDQSNK